MPRRQTYAQMKADEFDRDLYRLVARSAELERNKELSPSQRALWRRVSVALSHARPDVRSMMHPETSAETV